MRRCSAICKAEFEVGTLGYQSPAIMAEQKVTNVKIIAGEQLGGQNLIMRKGAIEFLEGFGRQANWLPPRQLRRDSLSRLPLNKGAPTSLRSI